MGWELSFIAIPLALVLVWGLRSRARDAIQLVPAQPMPRSPSPRFDASPELGVLDRPVQDPGMGIDISVAKGGVEPPVVRFFAPEPLTEPRQDTRDETRDETREETFEDPTTQVPRPENFDDPTSPVTPVPQVGGFEDAVTRINDTPKPPDTMPKGSMPRLPALRAVPRHPTPLFEPRVEDAAAAIAAMREDGDDTTNIVPFPRARSPRSTPVREDTGSTVITSAPDRR